MTVELILTYLIDILYLILTLSGIILVGAFYLLPRMVYEENSFYKLLPDLLEIRPEKPKEMVFRIRGGEVVIIHAPGDWEYKEYHDLFKSIGLEKWVYLGVCRSYGCVIRFIVNNKEAINCIMKMNNSAVVSRNLSYIFGKKYLLMFDETTALDVVKNCLLSQPLFSSDINYTFGIDKKFVVREKGKDYNISLVFANKNYELVLIKKLDEVKVA